jgi:pimeloyl-ACP methyl ester carboxylesterase
MTNITTRKIEANGLSFVIDECGTGDAVALFLHGFPESRFSWREQLPLLAKMGWRAVAPDMRGYGDSSRPKGKHSYQMEHLLADTVGLFDALGARRRLLIAHDWGALIAWCFANDRLRELDGLIIMNVPHPAIMIEALKHNPAQKKKSWYALFFQIPWLPEFVLTANGAKAIGQAFVGMAIDKSRFPQSVLDHYQQNALKPGAMTAMINYYRANKLALRAYSHNHARKIETATLMVWGEEDTALGIELSEGYEPYVADLTLNRLPNVSHWVQQEAPEAVNGHVTAWMKAKGLILSG